MAKIVVGVDGSDSAKEALGWALEEARLRGADVVAVHAWESAPVMLGPGPAPGFDIVGAMPQLEEPAERLVQTVVDDVAGDNPDVTVERRAVAGPTVEVLVDAARDADLLVVGSRGLGGFKQLLLGSVSQQLAHHAACPLVIYRRAD